MLKMVLSSTARACRSECLKPLCTLDASRSQPHRELLVEMKQGVEQWAGFPGVLEEMRKVVLHMLQAAK